MGKTESTGNNKAQQRLTLSIFAYFLTEEQVRKGHHYILRHVITSGLIVIILAIFVWIGGNLFGFRYQVQNTVVTARASDTALSHLIQTKISNYRLAITQPDGKTQSFSLQDIGLQVDVDNSIAIARAQQHKLSNRLQWWRPIPFKLTTSIDGNTLRTFMRDHAIIIVEPARDASLSLINGTTQITEAQQANNMVSPTQRTAS